MDSNMASMGEIEEMHLDTKLSDLNPTESIRLLNTYVGISEIYIYR